MSKALTSLKATTPTSSTRYDSRRSVEPVVRTTAIYGEESRPLYLMPFCTSVVNPEGQLYYTLQNEIRFIIEQPMQDPKVQERVLSWSSKIVEILKERAIVLPPSAEIYLNTSEDGETCWYYIADHDSKVISWIEPVSTADIGLRPSVSDEHIRFALNECYWNHVEYYSAHDCGVIDLQMDNLFSVLVQCKTDQLTSEDSTFPFSAQKCEDFLQVIRDCRAIESPDITRIRWSIARIWGLVCNHRFMTHYGQQTARLSRDQLILDVPEAKEGRMFRLQSRMLFSIPKHYNVSLEKLFSDAIIYQTEWREFIPKCRDEWTLSTALSFAVLICNLIILGSSHGSQALSKVSTAFSAAAVSAGTVLLTKHQRSGMWTAAQAATYLTYAHNGSSGFHSLACQFSLPRALLLWALAAFSLQVPFLFADMSDHSMLVILGTALVLCFIIYLCHMLLTRCWSFLRGIRHWRIFQSRSIRLDDTLPY
ncbi:hypothetical protein QCA50_020249 [Cerrena zonata]|uniref:WW domain-containing protein n=1 Tax=Cerrena zonata TaxID=2478898 RepID=A0AAW0F9G1_9APHY